MPPSIANRARSKTDSLKLFADNQDRIAASSSVLVVGGGAAGIQFSTDIKSHYPEKQVTLVHSRDRFLPNFDQYLHDAVSQNLPQNRFI
jgi:apoptosis-inducing factor 2